MVHLRDLLGCVRPEPQEVDFLNIVVPGLARRFREVDRHRDARIRHDRGFGRHAVVEAVLVPQLTTTWKIQQFPKPLRSESNQES